VLESMWYTFPASMGDNQAWITFDNGYAEVASATSQPYALRIRTDIKYPTDAGMPTSEEFEHLSDLDERLEATLEKNNSTYVGRVTVAGKRFFYFFTDIEESAANAILTTISNETSYNLEAKYELDNERSYYWDQLYPTSSDWRVIKDLSVLDQLDEHGDERDSQRAVSHWAYFNNKAGAQAYSERIKQFGFIVSSIEKDDDRFVVRFEHTGTMLLADITSFTIRANFEAEQLGGDYDGWETPIVRKTEI